MRSHVDEIYAVTQARLVSRVKVLCCAPASALLTTESPLSLSTQQQSHTCKSRSLEGMPHSGGGPPFSLKGDGESGELGRGESAPLVSDSSTWSELLQPIMLMP